MQMLAQEIAEEHEPQRFPRGALDALAAHWPEYGMEAAALGIFMISACVATVLLEHPASPLHQMLADSPFERRVLAGIAMGFTALGLFFSSWGKRSGAHMNPAVTLTFLWLGKIQPWDALYYVAFQFLGGVGGVFVSGSILQLPLEEVAVNYVVTVPGSAGTSAAFAGEFLISALMMTVVLWVSNSKRLNRSTPIFASALIALFIAVEAPYSGMSMNPARTLGSAVPARLWTALWIYFVAPIAAMLFAGALFRFRRGLAVVYCAKFHHHNTEPCIFRSRYGELNEK